MKTIILNILAHALVVAGEGGGIGVYEVKFVAPKSVKGNWYWQTMNNAEISETEMATIKLNVKALIKEKFNIDDTDCRVVVRSPLSKRRVPGEKPSPRPIKYVLSVRQIIEYDNDRPGENSNEININVDDKLEIIKQ